MWFRLCQGRSVVLAPDRGHLHHQLMMRGSSTTMVVLKMNLLAMVMAGLGLLGWQLGVSEVGLFTGFVFGFMIFTGVMAKIRANANSLLKVKQGKT